MEEPSADDHWQALAVLHRYCWAIDHHDELALRDVFSEDVELLVYPDQSDSERSSASGRDAVVAALSTLFARRSWARHFISNELVDWAADGTLTIGCYFRFVLAETTARMEGLGDYEAHLVDRGDGLAISRLAVHILEQGGGPVR